MLSRSTRLGLAAVVVPWQKIIFSKTLLLPSPLHPSTLSFFTPVTSSNPVPPILRISRNFWWPGVGQQQMKNSLFVEATASTDDPRMNSNQTPLQDQLQRHGVHESDYTSHKVKSQEPDFSQEDLKEQKTTRRSRMPRKRKPSGDLTSSSSKHPPSKEKIGEGEKVATSSTQICGVVVKHGIDYVSCNCGKLRQHNGEIAGGAKSARAGRPWRLVCTVQGFNSRSEACQFEWRWKSTAAKIEAIKQHEWEPVESPLIMRRRVTLAKILESEDWNYLNVQWHAH